MPPFRLNRLVLALVTTYLAVRQKFPALRRVTLRLFRR